MNNYVRIIFDFGHNFKGNDLTNNMEINFISSGNKEHIFPQKLVTQSVPRFQ